MNININDELSTMIAYSVGWRPVIENTEVEMEGDSYPMIENPVSMEQFMEIFIPKYMEDNIVIEGNKKILNTFKNIYNKMEEKTNKGEFRDLILSGKNEEEILQLVISQL